MHSRPTREGKGQKYHHRPFKLKITLQKPFSVGHLRSTVGDALFEYLPQNGLQHDKINHLGIGVNSRALMVAKNGVARKPSKPTQSILLNFTFGSLKSKTILSLMKKDVNGSKLKMGSTTEQAMVPWRKLGEFNRIYKISRCWVWQLKRRSFLQRQDDKRSNPLKTKACWKESKGASIVDGWCQPSTVLWLRSHATYITRDIAHRYLPCTILQLCENIYARSRTIQPLPSCWKLFWRQWIWLSDVIWFTLTLVCANRQKLSTASEIILLEPTLQEAIFSPKRRSKKKNPELKTAKKCMQSVLVRLNSPTTLEDSIAVMGMTSTSKPWALKEKLTFTFNTLTLVSNPSCQLHTIYRCNLQLERSWKPMLLPSQVLKLKTMIHPDRNMLSTWLKLNKYYAILLYLDEAQNAKAVLLLATQLQ